MSLATAAPSPTEVALRACRPGEIAIGGVDLNGYLGTAGFVIYDIGAQNCNVQGRATVKILDASGSPLSIQTQPWETEYDAPAGLLLLAGNPTPAPAEGLFPGSVGVQLGWLNWCGATWTSGTLVVDLPDLGELSAPITGSTAPACTDPNSPSTMLVGPITSPR